ncbi:bifunctional metallophosphatase/5'-nucleotidase [Sphingomonas xanthus]|nr:5'-nucleotidase C-terminal domain-containing protein [Sphingomonas xanthus]
MARLLFAIPLLFVAACVQAPPGTPVPPSPTAGPIEVQVLGINDFHGNLEPPKTTVDATLPGGAIAKIPVGGVAYLATAAQSLRNGHPRSVTVSAGDMVGASPLVSSLFLDEPAIEAMEEVGVEFNAVGNHEFDRGSAELVRLQSGGCAQHTMRKPCVVEPFDGADFQFLAANVRASSGRTLFPGTAIKDFGDVQIGIIGMTLKETASLVTPAGVAGLTFEDEAATVNAAIPALKAAGADAILVLIHQGGRTTGGYNDKSCPGLDGDIMPIIARLDPAVDLVVSGHTHYAYVCHIARTAGRPLLLTSAGRYGTMISDIRLQFDAEGRLQHSSADNILVQGEGFAGPGGQVPVHPAFPVFARHPATAALVDKYTAAALPLTQRVVGSLDGPITKEANEDRELTGGNFIADAQLAATRQLGAQIAFSNTGGVRADIVPGKGGAVTFGQIFAMQPFGNSLVVLTLSGAQLKALLEQQFDSGTNTVARPNMLLPSEGFRFAYDLSRPAGERIVDMRLHGRRIVPTATYKVTVVNFLASGGDNFSVLKGASAVVDANILDVDATEAYLKAGGNVPSLGRIDDRTPRS